MSITLRATLPGEVDQADTDAEQIVVAPQWGTTDAPGTALSWQVPIDGGRTPVEGTTTLSLERSGPWGIVAWSARALLVLWIVVAIVLIAAVARSATGGSGGRRATCSDAGFGQPAISCWATCTAVSIAIVNPMFGRRRPTRCSPEWRC